ncbi:MAG: YkgJ family cysteine cluster protein, partial [Planctomycetota bacterium]
MPDLLLPPGIRYVCIRCGACCRSLEVTLTEAEHERLAAHDWSAEQPDYAPDRYFARLRGARGKQAWRLRPLPSGACRFLTDEGLCRVHAALGYQAKPFAGRLFPFTFTVTPVGV